MDVPFSIAWDRLRTGAFGIESLMDDLGHAMASGTGNLCMLGGGNPAAIPQVTETWREETARLLREDPGRFDRMLVNYDPSRGNPEFLGAIVDLFNSQYGWGITKDNIVVTNGGQTAFFYLFNLLAGDVTTGPRHVLLPVVPEYMGYAAQGLSTNLFRACRPRIEQLTEDRFKYRVDFDALHVSEATAAICLSRPTNPTGNVATDEEVARLRTLASENNIPLIVDNAYGVPFPNITFKEVRPPWGENVILTYSLSKLGLPGTRTGIVIGPERVTSALSSINAVAGLANGNVGQVLVTPLLRDGRLLALSREVIGPFYQRKSRQAEAWLAEFLPLGSYRVHVSEGALFLWVQFRDLTITTLELYERLKARGVLIIPGEHFFFGLDGPWDHQRQCIRMSFAMPADVVRKGIQTIAEEVAKARCE